MRHISHNEKETTQIAKNFAKRLRGGEVILLYGDLGAGKTVFVKALAKALGVRETVKSPTFNIMKCYNFQFPISNFQSNQKSKIKNLKLFCHIDAYRLKNFEDLLDIGADEYIRKPNVITVIEWAERIDKKSKIKTVKIRHGEKENERIITIN